MITFWWLLFDDYRVIEKFFGLVGGWGDVKLQLEGVGKLNGWVLELNFAGQIINFKFLFWIFILSLNLFISLFVDLHLFIYSFIIWYTYIWMSFVDFINCEMQSNLIIYIEFVYINLLILMFNYFNISVFACVCVWAFFY